MSIVHNIWYMFKYMKMGDWGENELRIAKWLMPVKPKPPEPTRRLDDLIGSLWGGSWWSYRIMLSLWSSSG